MKMNLHNNQKIILPNQYYKKPKQKTIKTYKLIKNILINKNKYLNQ